MTILPPTDRSPAPPRPPFPADAGLFAARLWSFPPAGELDAAVAWLEAAIPAAAPLAAARHLADLGALLHAAGRAERAQESLERALLVAERLPGGEAAAAEALTYLGTAFADRRDTRYAQLYVERALALARASLGPHHPATAMTLASLGELLRAQDEAVRARVCGERALARLDATLGPRHPAAARARIALADSCAALGDVPAARRNAERARDLCQDELGDHPLTAQALACLGRLAARAYDRRAAREYLDRALAIYAAWPHLRLAAHVEARAARAALTPWPLRHRPARL